MNKYGARAFTDSDGVRWHSIGEYMRYGELKILLNVGQITRFSRQVRYPLHALGGEPVGAYIADFVYTENGEEIIEDYKGFLNAFAKWKLKHFEAQYHKKVRLTGAASRKRAILRWKAA